MAWKIADTDNNFPVYVCIAAKAPYQVLTAENRRKSMYQKGDYIVYGTKGVCLIEDVAAISWAEDCISSKKLCYKLVPRFVKGSTIYAPVENEKTVIRSVMSGEEAEAVLNGAGKLETLSVKDEKEREDHYRRALSSGNSMEWSRIVKTLYLRKQERLRTGKRMTCIDERYLHVAENILFGEMSMPLHMTVKEVEKKYFQNVDSSVAEIRTAAD